MDAARHSHRTESQRRERVLKRSRSNGRWLLYGAAARRPASPKKSADAARRRHSAIRSRRNGPRSKPSSGMLNRTTEQRPELGLRHSGRGCSRRTHPTKSQHRARILGRAPAEERRYLHGIVTRRRGTAVRKPTLQSAGFRKSPGSMARDQAGGERKEAVPVSGAVSRRSISAKGSKGAQKRLSC